MFNWFFNPKKKIKKDYAWLAEQPFKSPKTEKDVVGIFNAVEKTVKNLNRTSLEIFLEGEDIIKKCAELSVKVRNGFHISVVETNLQSYESLLRKRLDDILEAVNIAKEEIGTKSLPEVFDIFKDLAKNPVEEIQ